MEMGGGGGEEDEEKNFFVSKNNDLRVKETFHQLDSRLHNLEWALKVRTISYLGYLTIISGDSESMKGEETRRTFD